jgi:hypothetical protein
MEVKKQTARKMKKRAMDMNTIKMMFEGLTDWNAPLLKAWS